MTTPGTMVRTWRESRGWSGTALAQKLGVSAARVCQIERDACKASVRLAGQIEYLSKGAVYAGDLNSTVRALDYARGLTRIVCGQPTATVNSGEAYAFIPTSRVAA